MAPGFDGSGVSRSGATVRVALIGNPNVGKTTLFNRWCAASHHTSNFPGTTQEARFGAMTADAKIELIDLPGMYSFLDGSAESAACRRVLSGDEKPDAVCVVIDVANVTRGLRVVRESIEAGHAVFVLLTDVGRGEETSGLARALAKAADVRAIGIEGSERAFGAVARDVAATGAVARVFAADWADVTAGSVSRGAIATESGTRGDRADRLALHPVAGVLIFAAVMWGLFYSVFAIAAYPMDWIEGFFSWLSGALRGALPDGPVASLVAEGIVGGVGATLVFLPQIAMLFFLISLLEESGYLARGALLADRVLRPFGLPGSAFVPLLSAHACAIPSIVACRTIRDVRERVTAILVLPFMSCSARLAVYALLVSFLFADNPALAATAFAGCYALGAAAALATSLLARRTILRGPASTLAIELPKWRVPRLGAALKAAAVRSGVFLRKAGTVILVMMMALWWLSNYPEVGPGAESQALAAAAEVAPDEDRAAELRAEAERMAARDAARGSFMGQIGRAAAPVFGPLGYDWQISIGVMSSFAAREVFVSTMSVVLAGEEEGEGILDRMKSARRDDGSLVFSTATLWSLLVFYVLAMQCLPTLAVTAREAGGVRWAVLQLGWMTIVAYVGAIIARAIALGLGG